MNKIQLSPLDFEKLFCEKLSEYVKNKINSYELIYSEVSNEETLEIVNTILETLLDPFLIYSGSHRLEQWEKGWGENLNELSKEKLLQSIKPKYFGKYPINRLNKKFIKGESKDFERNMLYVILDYIFDKYFRPLDNIFEFGCGPGHNLLKVREVNNKANLFGLDWTKASQQILKKIELLGITNNISGINFDFFNPDYKIEFPKNSGVYTVAALEQTGKNYKKFVQYLIRNKPKICIHVEPISEVLDSDNLIDNLSIKYFQKRKYLNLFLTHLKKLEEKGMIEIHSVKRTFIGSMYIEGYTVIAWSPIEK